MGKAKKIVVVGGVACGPKTAARARRRDPDAEILIIDRGKHPSYAGCGLPFYVAGAVKTLDGLTSTVWGTVRDEKYFKDVKNIDLLMQTSAEFIDREKKELTLKNLATSETSTVAYDKLVLATGARPVIPPIDGADLKNVFTLRRLEDAERIVQCINEIDAEKAVIIGGGRISLEIVDALTAQAVDSTVVEMMDQLLPSVLDEDMAGMLAATLKKEGVVIHTGEKVLRLEGGSDGNVSKVVTDKREIETDFVLVAAGVKPNTELAESAGLEITEDGTIAVNEYLQTSDPDIYAGGDCVQCTNLVTGEKIYAPLGSTANKHGRVIGNNITGGSDTFPGVLGTGVMKTMGLNVGRTGLTCREAEDTGFKVVTALVPGHDKSHFYPGGKEMFIKLIADSEDGRILGAQMVGAGDVIRRLDIAAAMMSCRATAGNLANLDMGYAPPFASAMDPLIHAANLIRNKIDGTAETISVEELKEKLSSEEDFLIIDVRTPAEFESLAIDDQRLVEAPLEEFRAKSGEFSKDKKAIVICRIGTRAYEAGLTLKSTGFSDVSFLEGGMAAWQDSEG